jgi:hypothetical protein
LEVILKKARLKGVVKKWKRSRSIGLEAICHATQQPWINRGSFNASFNAGLNCPIKAAIEALLATVKPDSQS